MSKSLNHDWWECYSPLIEPTARFCGNEMEGDVSRERASASTASCSICNTFSRCCRRRGFLLSLLWLAADADRRITALRAFSAFVNA